MEDTETPCEDKYGETTNDSNYDVNCTLSRSRSGTYKITGRLVFVSQSVRVESPGFETRRGKETYVFERKVVQTGCEAHPVLKRVPGTPSRSQSGRSVRINTHVYPMPKFKTEWSCTCSLPTWLHCAYWDNLPLY
jgi:hypothetical protein